MASLAAAACGSQAWAGQPEAPPELQVEPFRLSANQNAQESSFSLVTRFGVWATSVEGTVTTESYEADFDAGFDDLFDNTNFALAPIVEIGMDRWLIAFNGMFTQLEADKSFRGTLPNGKPVAGGATITNDMYIADLALGYRLFDIPLGEGDGAMMLSIGPAIGLRYTYFSVEVDPDEFPSRSKSKELWDPYVGVRANLQLTDQLAWRTDASIGGFGVGSDLTWSAQTFLDWRFHPKWELNVGYRALYYDYDGDRFELDLTMHGPWIGLSHIWR